MTRPAGLEFKTLATAEAVAGPAAEPDAQGTVTALVAVTGVKDSVGDIIEPGAFRRTLGERPRPKVCLGHDWNRPVGKTLEIRELLPGDRRLPAKTAEGKPWPREAGAVWAHWQANLDSDDGRSAYSAAKFFGPEESTFSIGYRTVRARQRGSTRHIHDLDLFEYGPVLNPANRLATLQTIKAAFGDGEAETKARYVHDSGYWGRPVGTPITAGMKPRGGKDRKRGTTTTPLTGASGDTGNMLSRLSPKEQDAVRALPIGDRVEYIKRRAAGDDHGKAMGAVRPDKPSEPEDKPVAPKKPTPAENKPAEPAKPSAPEKPAAEDKPAAKPEGKPATPEKPKKITRKQKAALLSATPGPVATYRRDENGQKIYRAPYPVRQGLIAKIHANSAFPLEQAGYVEAGHDGRHYILTDKGEQLRAQLSGGDGKNTETSRTEPAKPAVEPRTEPAKPAVEPRTEPAKPATPEPAEPAPESAPEAESASKPEGEAPDLPYKIVRKPTRGDMSARVSYNGHEYDVTATTGVIAAVTVADDDGHTVTVPGGSTTLLRRDQATDRERAVRAGLDQVAAMRGLDNPVTEPTPPELNDRLQSTGDVAQSSQDLAPGGLAPTEPEPAPAEPEPAPAESEPMVAIAPELLDEAASLQDEVLGITEQPDGTIEVTEEVAARQERVAALIDADDNGTLDLGSRSTPELAATRGELSDELALQGVLASRQAEPKPTVLTSPAGQPERPPQRPGLAGAAEDYSEALASGDAAAITRTRTRLESSLRRSRVTSDTARTLADHITGEGDDEAERLSTLARGLRQESRDRRNAAARRRRQARRLERVRIQSLMDKIDSELQTRARSTEPQPVPAPAGFASADPVPVDYSEDPA